MIFLKGLFILTAWTAFSSCLIVINKQIYSDLSFAKPSFLTGLGQFGSFLGGLVLVQLGFLPCRKIRDRRWGVHGRSCISIFDSPFLSILRAFILKLSPVILSTAATMWFGNAAYLFLSVSFIQILKSFTPGLTLATCLIFGIEKPQWRLVLSILLITIGTAGSVVEESIGIDFSFLGLALFLASSLSEAFRVVGADLLLGKDKDLGCFNGAEALIFIGGPSSLLLLLGSFLFEDMGLGSRSWWIIYQSPLPFLFAVVMSFLVNLSCFMAIQATSSLTFKIAGSIKNILVIVYGVFFVGESVTAFQIFGYSVSLLGFGLYAQMRKPVQEKKNQ